MVLAAGGGLLDGWVQRGTGANLASGVFRPSPANAWPHHVLACYTPRQDPPCAFSSVRACAVPSAVRAQSYIAPLSTAAAGPPGAR